MLQPHIMDLRISSRDICFLYATGASIHNISNSQIADRMLPARINTDTVKGRAAHNVICEPVMGLVHLVIVSGDDV
ncbi:hypothetical protein D3C72_2085290 [compost metagenome]